MGHELFANRDYFGPFIDRYGEVRPLVHKFRGFSGSVALEAELERLQDQSKNRAQLRRQLTALRYYLQRVIVSSTKEWSDRLHGVTNYVRLVDDIDSLWTEGRGGKVCFVTFNYDTLLDGALGQIGIRFGKNLESYTADDRYKLIKPHGSVDWFHPVVSGISINSHPYVLQIIKDIDKIEVSDQFIMHSEHSDIDDLAALPALSIPVARKTQFEAPAAHIRVLEALIPSVTHLLLIGWRGNEEHFRQMLDGVNRKTVASLVVTSGLGSAAVVAHSLGLSTQQPAVSERGFTDLLRGTELSDFLAR